MPLNLDKILAPVTIETETPPHFHAASANNLVHYAAFKPEQSDECGFFDNRSDDKGAYMTMVGEIRCPTHMRHGNKETLRLHLPEEKTPPNHVAYKERLLEVFHTLTGTQPTRTPENNGIAYEYDLAPIAQKYEKKLFEAYQQTHPAGNTIELKERIHAVLTYRIAEELTTQFAKAVQTVEKERNPKPYNRFDIAFAPGAAVSSITAHRPGKGPGQVHIECSDERAVKAVLETLEKSGSNLSGIGNNSYSIGHHGHEKHELRLPVSDRGDLGTAVRELTALLSEKHGLRQR